MVKRNAIATRLTKVCTQTQKRAFDVAVYCNVLVVLRLAFFIVLKKKSRGKMLAEC